MTTTANDLQGEWRDPRRGAGPRDLGARIA